MKSIRSYILNCLLFSPILMYSQLDGNLLFGLTQATTIEMNTVLNPVVGSLLYNTDEEKMYLNTATGFKKIPSIDNTSIDFWGATGTANTNPLLHYLGTSDAQDFILKTDGTERIRISSTGNIGFNNTTPSAQVDIESAEVPLRIQPSATTPTGTENGQIFMGNDGILYAYDALRGKWLSVDRTFLGWGYNSALVTTTYLRQLNGVDSDNSGWRMLRNGTITGLTAQTQSNKTWTLEIRKNDGILPLAVLVITVSDGAEDDSLNVDFDQGDFLQAYCNGIAIDYPEALLEIAWRK